MSALPQGATRLDFAALIEQHGRLLQIETALPNLALIPERMVLREAVSQPFELVLDCLSTSALLELKRLVGEQLSVRLLQPDGRYKPWHGYVLEAGVNDEIRISAKECIELVGGDSSIVLNGADITFTTPGTFAAKGSTHAFLGGGGKPGGAGGAAAGPGGRTAHAARTSLRLARPRTGGGRAVPRDVCRRHAGEK